MKRWATTGRNHFDEEVQEPTLTPQRLRAYVLDLEYETMQRTSTTTNPILFVKSKGKAKTGTRSGRDLRLR